MSETTPPAEPPAEQIPEEPIPEESIPEESAPEEPAEETIEERRARARARTEAKNQARREELEPLAPGERPLAVTIASVAAMLIAIGNLLAYFFSNDLSGQEEKRAIIQLALICGVLGAASIGMWRAKYWAVLGFQTILGLQIIVYSLALTRVERAPTALLLLVIIIASATLFWFMIRAMARIQMPEGPVAKEIREEDEAAAAAAEIEAHAETDGKLDD